MQWKREPRVAIVLGVDRAQPVCDQLGVVELVMRLAKNGADLIHRGEPARFVVCGLVVAGLQMARNRGLVNTRCKPGLVVIKAGEIESE